MGMGHQQRGWTSHPPTPAVEHPHHPGLSPTLFRHPRLLCGHGCSLPCGRERWLGGFFVSIFGNPGRAVPHPQAFGIWDGKFHLWGRYGNEQSWEGGLQRERRRQLGGAPKVCPPPSLDSLRSIQKDPVSCAHLRLAAPSPPLVFGGHEQRCARIAPPWGPAEILLLPAQGCCPPSSLDTSGGICSPVLRLMSRRA